MAGPGQVGSQIFSSYLLDCEKTDVQLRPKLICIYNLLPEGPREIFGSSLGDNLHFNNKWQTKLIEA